MDISYKFVLDKRRTKKNDLYPLKLRVFQNRKFKEKSTGIFLNESSWNAEHQIIQQGNSTTDKNVVKLNALKAKIDRIMLLSEDSAIPLTADRLIEQLDKNSHKKADVRLADYGDKLISSLNSANRVGTALAYRDAVNSMKRFAGDTVLIKDINYLLLEKYKSQLLSEGVKPNSIAAYLRSIRAIYNKAIKEELIEQHYYPFNKFRIQTEDTFSRALSIDEMKKIVCLHLPENTPAWHAKNFFLLSFCLIGINYTDLFTLSKENVIDGVLRYRRHKTSKLYSIGLQAEAQQLFKLYASYKSNNEHKYLLPVLRNTDDSKQRKGWLKQIVKTNNHYLKDIADKSDINKPITTYYARYTWANIAKQLGYSKDMIAEALGHEYGNKVTGIYLDMYDRTVIDEMNSRIAMTVLHPKIP